MKKPAKIAAFILILAIAALSITINNYNQNISGVDPTDSTPIYIEIPSGASPNKIGEILLENSLIKDITTYKIYLKLNNLGSAFKAGEYSFDKTMDLASITKLLESGGNVVTTMDITIQEGLTLLEAAEAINRQLPIDIEEFLRLCNNVEYFAQDFDFLNDPSVQSLEGYLFPDTYNIYIKSTEEDIISRLLKGYEKIYEELMIPAKNYDLTLNQLMTMASIVEGEALLDEERPLVASVFYNRIEKSWRLESCATVQYALGERKSVLTYADLEVVSPYNTYTHFGLPPAPINSPGRASIEAALYPEESIYMFFLAKGDGSHYFTDDYDDFLRAKERYITNR
jgi:UPF0755 protein